MHLLGEDLVSSHTIYLAIVHVKEQKMIIVVKKGIPI